jgi:2-amino-4-hydroxy-6-hydroxymethyldihydropteridine diphosphokinase
MQAIIGIGSNIRPAENIRKSIGLLAKLTRLRNLSHVYFCAAENRPEQPWFYNCAVIVETGLTAERLEREVLARIETDLGRVRTADKFAARTIDLDLLVCGSAAVDPEVLNHLHVAIPLAELAPELTLADSDRLLGEAVRELPGAGIEKLAAYSASLFREFVGGQDAAGGRAA